MGVLSEDESDTSALFTESELDDSDLDFARRRPRAPVAPPRGAPANDARDDAPRFSSEDEEIREFITSNFSIDVEHRGRRLRALHPA